MLVTEFGMVTEVKPVQPAKAAPPMLVTEFGMVTEVRPVQPLKAPLPITFTVDGMVTSPPLPTYANSCCFVSSAYTKSPSVTPFIEMAPHGLPVAVP